MPGSRPDDVRTRTTELTMNIRPVGRVDVGRSTSSLGGAGVDTSADPIAVPLPDRIGRFEVRSFLGAGAFGWVYRAFDPTLRRDVAIKILRPERVNTAAERERLLKEARAAATVRHPQIVPIYEVGEDVAGAFIVMGLLAGVSMSSSIAVRSEPFDPREAAGIIRGLAGAVAAAHGKGIVHRDLKPANILYDDETAAYTITDFGLARVTDCGDPTASHTGLVGSPAYMSPEQARGDAVAVGPASDVHALGAILYELLTRELPYPGKTVVEVAHQVNAAPVPDPAALNPAVPPELAAICRKAMAKEVADRYSSARELAEALGAFETSQSMRLPVPTPAAVKPVGPRRMRVLLGVFAVVAAVIAGVVFYTRTNSATVRVELDVDTSDPALTFTLDGKPVERERLAKPIELMVGDHELVVVKAGKAVRRYAVNVARGRDAAGITVLEREPEPAAAAPKPKPAPAEPEDVRSGAYDARAASELLKIGAAVGYAVGEDPTVNKLTADKPLPRGARIVQLVFNENPTRPNDDDLKLLAGLTRLDSLSIINCDKVTNAGIKHIAGLSGLRSLSLVWLIEVTDEGFESIGKLTGLEHLDLVDMPVSDAGLRHLAGLTRLKHLIVSGHAGPGRATGSFLADLKGLTKLEELGLGSQPLRGDNLAHLKAFPELVHLYLYGNGLEDESLQHLRRLRLQTLTLSNNPKVTDRGMKAVAELVWLDNLSVNQTGVGDDGARLLATLPRLKYLDLRGTKVTANGLGELKKALPTCDIHPAPPKT